MPKAMFPDKVVSGSMGSFLCPPTHPAHFFHVETDRNRRKCNRGGIPLEAAKDYSWIHWTAKNTAETMLRDWARLDRPAIDSEEIEDWIVEVLRYFKNCYLSSKQIESGKRNVTDLICNSDLNPYTYKDIQAGVHFIKRYYPEFKVTNRLIAIAHRHL